MQRKTTIMAALATATMLAAAPAMAQDTGERATHFNGFYIGAGGGYDVQSTGDGTVEFDTDRNGNYDNTVLNAGGGNAFAPGFCDGFPRSNTPSNPPPGCKGDKDRGEYFGRIGYDRRMGNFVLGAVLEGGKTDAVDRTTAFSGTPHNYSFTRGVDWMAAARLRAGYTPNGGILFYATGGGVYANMKHGFFTTNTTSTFTQQGSDDAWGYQAGGGIEAMVTKQISIGLEYLYTDINDDKTFVTAVTPASIANPTGVPFGTGGTNLRPRDQSFNYHAIRGTVNFRF
ncbi:outer membrane beta-barrel protein [Sphingobium sufflavum]|uniref:outer membrane protein n=1 Tax=Sphingobium sufflavum TaxID=1129547 RepID=UPI001F3822A5|nr:outer membrane beta-barrel protein [Sphingobium sufflavum]MCE7797679.1 outer membrane beta-barrel protein [Sphingobium sufflavum]